MFLFLHQGPVKMTQPTTSTTTPPTTTAAIPTTTSPTTATTRLTSSSSNPISVPVTDGPHTTAAIMTTSSTTTTTQVRGIKICSIFLFLFVCPQVMHDIRIGTLLDIFWGLHRITGLGRDGQYDMPTLA